VIRTWPGPSKDADQVWKTPSRIAYPDESPEKLKPGSAIPWGYQVKPGMKSYSWTKLLLDGKTKFTMHDDKSLETRNTQEGYLRLPPDKSAVDVVTDYLCEVNKFMLAELEKTLSPELVKVTPFEFWFTVPAIWSDRAKDLTRRAALKAGFGKRPGDQIFMIPEPEAASIATLKSLTHDEGDEQVKKGDGVLVCDCGGKWHPLSNSALWDSNKDIGGTVDITSYLIRETTPVLKFEELVVGGGGKCGSTAIDREFLGWMSKKFGPAFDNLPYEKTGPGSRFMKEFESHKRDFGSASLYEDYEVTLIIPGAQDSVNYEGDEKLVKFFKYVLHIPPGFDEYLLFRSDMITFFQPVISKIIALIQEQIDAAHETKKQKRASAINVCQSSSYLEHF